MKLGSSGSQTFISGKQNLRNKNLEIQTLLLTHFSFESSRDIGEERVPYTSTPTSPLESRTLLFT